MERFKTHARSTGLAVCSAMAIALLAGCAGHGAIASADAPAVADSDDLQAGSRIAKLESQVAKSPRNASARVALAQAYLASGRFESAATTFEDAVTLGNNDPRVGLGRALAYIGAGRNAEALTVLDRWHAQIPASDLGLALALAGQPAQGVAVLSDAVRGGEATAKARQNLAYAYALDGRWTEARVVASQDVPADQIDARLAEWASRVRPEQFQTRVASLIGAPVRADSGQPAFLALGGAAQPARMASVETAAPAPASTAELPAVDAAQDTPPALELVQEPAFAMPTEKATKAQAGARLTVQQSFPSLAPSRSARTDIPMKVRSSMAQTGTHLVQLGSFSSLESAKRASAVFAARNPVLKGHSIRITEAHVNGRLFYRVAAEGFERASAQNTCASVRQRGGACFAYASRGVPGAKPAGVPAGPMLAQR